MVILAIFLCSSNVRGVISEEPILLGGTGTETIDSYDPEHNRKACQYQHFWNHGGKISAKEHQFIETGECPGMGCYLGKRLEPSRKDEKREPAASQGC